MSIRNLDALLRPESVAVVGASERAGSLGRIIMENLLAAFEGPVWPVNPKYREIFGRPVLANVTDLESGPDLAVIATPADTVPGIIAALGGKGTRAACVISGGFSERSPSGAELRQTMLDNARPNLMRIVGPNCLGIQVPARGLNASFAHLAARSGNIALVAQSGAMITSMLDWATPKGIGFSHLVSLGDMADVDFGDMLDYLASESTCQSVLLYVEAITQARKFMSAARAAARCKPVIVVKGGRHAAGARAAASHTGALAGEDAVYAAAFRRAGALRVLTLESLFDAVESLALARTPRGDRLAILTNGGGMGVLATDALMDAGGRLAELSEQTLARLNAILPPLWPGANPVDIGGDADGDRYSGSIDALLDDDNVDAVLVMACPTGVSSPTGIADALIECLPESLPKTVLTCWLGEASVEVARDRLHRRGIPTYESPADAVNAFMQMVDYQRNQSQLMETPPSLPEVFEPDIEAARRCIAEAVEQSREWLNAAQVSDLFDAYGIPIVESRIAADLDAVDAAAAEFDQPIAIKIRSPDITHKSDVGGVALDVQPASARQAAAEMAARVRHQQPEAHLEGFLLQSMARKRGAHELIVGIATDPLFGPVILFGQGGTAVEVIDDKALALPPLNLKLAGELIHCTRVSHLLAGFRNVPPADLEALKLLLVRISQMVVDLPRIRELDINPVLADSDGVLALDARVRVDPSSGHNSVRLAIRPYPKELEARLSDRFGRSFLLRPITPEDGPSLQAAFGKLNEEEIRFRFFAPLKILTQVMAARFSQIDYDRQMALVLTDDGPPGKTEIYGVVRITEDPDRTSAEFAIVIERALSGKGLGTQLMKHMIDYTRSRGIGTLFGQVMWENERMLSLARSLGFTVIRDTGDPGIARVSLDLG